MTTRLAPRRRRFDRRFELGLTPEAFPEILERLRHTARHPRLDQPMTIVDLCLFVAEHDGHHLASMTRCARSAAS